MSNSSLAREFIEAKHYSNGRDGRKIEYIAIHHMAGVLSAESCGKIIFQSYREASSHYGIGNDGDICQYVDEQNTAWANTNWDSNCKSVTIETSNSATNGNWPVSDKALESLIKLVADISKRNNITLVKGKTLVWHRMYVATTCPGEYLLSKMDYIIEEANKINNKTSQTSQNIDELARDVIAGKYGVGSARKNALGENYEKVQARVNEILLGVKTPSKTIDEIAKEVIQGKWGNGLSRKQKLTAAGYNATEVQNRVNKMLR